MPEHPFSMCSYPTSRAHRLSRLGKVGDRCWRLSRPARCQPQSAKGADEEQCSVSLSPKDGGCATCGMPGCNDHFETNTKR
eukprot:1732259-Pyramimonas_sp.AAC.1